MFLKSNNFDINVVGNNITNARKNRKLTQEELANLLNTNRATVSKWERSINIPSTEMIFLISKVLNVPVDVLIGLKDEEIVVKKKSKIKNIIIKVIILILIMLLFFGIYYFINNYKKNKVYAVYLNDTKIGVAVKTNDTFIFDCKNFDKEVSLYYKKDNDEKLIYRMSDGRLFFETFLGYNDFFDFKNFNNFIDNLYISFDNEEKEKLVFELMYVNDNFFIKKNNNISEKKTNTNEMISDDLTKKIMNKYEKNNSDYVYYEKNKDYESVVYYIVDASYIYYGKNYNDGSVENWFLYLTNYEINYNKKDSDNILLDDCSSVDNTCNKKVNEFYEFLYKTLK